MNQEQVFFPSCLGFDPRSFGSLEEPIGRDQIHGQLESLYFQRVMGPIAVMAEILTKDQNLFLCFTHNVL